MDPYLTALELLPQKYRAALEGFAVFRPEEIRLRLGRSPAVSHAGKEYSVKAAPVGEADLVRVLEKATGASLYSARYALRRGYFCTGALRLGVCGQSSPAERGTGFASFSSINIRIARDLHGVCGEAADRLCGDGYVNTLILSPPGGGKTTALREIIRNLSDRGMRVGVIDERGELSARLYDLGRCSDVISGTDKLSGALLLLRTMTPQIIAADEISAPEDIQAVLEVDGCGAGILATAHARDTDDLMRREGYRELLRRGVFRKTLVIRGEGSARRYELKELQP